MEWNTTGSFMHIPPFPFIICSSIPSFILHELRHPSAEPQHSASMPRLTPATLNLQFHRVKLEVDYRNVALQWYDDITPLLTELHRLWMPQHIQYKLCALKHQYVGLHGPAPIYLTNAICPVPITELCLGNEYLQAPLWETEQTRLAQLTEYILTNRLHNCSP